MNVTDKTGDTVCSFTAFVNAADTAKPVAVVEIHGGATATPSLEWVPEGGSKGVFQSEQFVSILDIEGTELPWNSNVRSKNSLLFVEQATQPTETILYKVAPRALGPCMSV